MSGDRAYAELHVDEHGIWAVYIRYGSDADNVVVIENLSSAAKAMEAVDRWCRTRGYNLVTPIVMLAATTTTMN